MSISDNFEFSLPDREEAEFLNLLDILDPPARFNKQTTHQKNEAPEQPRAVEQLSQIHRVDRANERPSGNLTWMENGQIKQAAVVDGEIRHDRATVVGSLGTDGRVQLLDGRQFLIQETEGAVFRGTGSDGNQLVLVDNSRKNDFSGVLVGANMQDICHVVCGIVFDKAGKLEGYLDRSGMFKSPDGRLSHAIEKYTNWQFHGTEDGCARTFVLNDNTTQGHIFIPDTTGVGIRHTVKLGMLLGPDGVQRGLIGAPAIDSVGNLSGGSIILFDNPQSAEQPLSSLSGSVFSLRMLTTSRESVSIDGICSGSNSIYSLTRARRVETDRRLQAHAQHKQFEEANVFVRGWRAVQDAALTNTNASLERTSYQTSLKSADANLERIKRVIDTGSLDEYQNVSCAENFSKELMARDSVEFLHKLVSTQKPSLEKIPDNTAISGALRLPIFDVTGRTTGFDSYRIDQGQIVAENGEVVGAISDINQGRITFRKPHLAKIVTHMSELEGARWQFSYTSTDGVSTEVNWLSVGPLRGGVLSLADLSRRGQMEVQLAQRMVEAKDCDATRQALTRTTRSRDVFQRTINTLIKGVPQDQSTLQYLAEGPRKHVAPELYQSLESNQKSPELVRTITNEDAATAQGKLRIGEELYAINSGKIYRIGKNGLRTENAVGRFDEGYNIELDGQPPFNLGSRDRVLLEINVPARDGNPAKPLQILGLGQPRWTETGGFQPGGLIDTRQLKEQAAELVSQARANNTEYFRSRPYLTGWLGSIITGNTEHSMRELSESVVRDSSKMDEFLTELFRAGLSGEITSSQIASKTELTQRLLRNMYGSRSDASDLIQQTRAIQSQLNDGVVLAATGVATGGAGYLLRAARGAQALQAANGGARTLQWLTRGEQVIANSTAGRTIQALETSSRVGKLGVVGAQFAFETSIGAAVMTAGRSSESTDNWRNLGAASIEVSTMGLGGRARQGLSGLRALGQAPQVSPWVRSLVGTAGIGLNGTRMAAEVAGFDLAANIRHGEGMHISGDRIPLGMMFMGISQIGTASRQHSWLSSQLNTSKSGGVYAGLEGLLAGVRQEQDNDVAGLGDRAATLGISKSLLRRSAGSLTIDEYGRALEQALQTSAWGAMTPHLPFMHSAESQRGRSNGGFQRQIVVDNNSEILSNPRTSATPSSDRPPVHVQYVAVASESARQATAHVVPIASHRALEIIVSQTGEVNAVSPELQRSAPQEASELKIISPLIKSSSSSPATLSPRWRNASISMAMRGENYKERLLERRICLSNLSPRERENLCGMMYCELAEKPFMSVEETVERLLHLSPEQRRESGVSQFLLRNRSVRSIDYCNSEASEFSVLDKRLRLAETNQLTLELNQHQTAVDQARESLQECGLFSMPEQRLLAEIMLKHEDGIGVVASIAQTALDNPARTEPFHKCLAKYSQDQTLPLREVSVLTERLRAAETLVSLRCAIAGLFTERPAQRLNAALNEMPDENQEALRRTLGYTYHNPRVQRRLLKEAIIGTKVTRSLLDDQKPNQDTVAQRKEIVGNPVPEPIRRPTGDASSNGPANIGVPPHGSHGRLRNELLTELAGETPINSRSYFVDTIQQPLEPQTSDWRTWNVRFREPTEGGGTPMVVKLIDLVKWGRIEESTVEGLVYKAYGDAVIKPRGFINLHAKIDSGKMIATHDVLAAEVSVYTEAGQEFLGEQTLMNGKTVVIKAHPPQPAPVGWRDKFRHLPWYYEQVAASDGKISSTEWAKRNQEIEQRKLFHPIGQ